MTVTIEVFSDITCPFTHVGLERITSELESRRADVEILLRAWPLEWVNGAPLDRDAVEMKSAILTERLGVDSFDGLAEARWPATTIPALELTAAANQIDSATGLAVGLALRSALFRDGLDICDPDVLAAIAARHGVEPASTDGAARRADAVRRDYAEGQRRGVRGSPHYWAHDHDFFCPALVIDHDDDGTLTADFDPAGLSAFLDDVLHDAASPASAAGDAPEGGW